MVNQQELQQKASTLEVMRNEVEALEGQKRLLQNQIQTHDEAKKTVEKYSKESEGTEVLVHIGADTYIHTEVKNNEEVLVDIGNDLSTKRDVKDALEIIDRKKEKIKEDKEELQEYIDELNENADELEQEVREDYQKLQRQQQEQHGGGQVFQ